jgi:hypothetical protein
MEISLLNDREAIYHRHVPNLLSQPKVQIVRTDTGLGPRTPDKIPSVVRERIFGTLGTILMEGKLLDQIALTALNSLEG